VHGTAHDLKQPKALGNVEPTRVAENVDRQAVDVFHDDVCGGVGKSAAIQEARDIRMVELGEDLPLDPEAGLSAPHHGAAVHHFDGDFLFELGVGAFGEENLAHTADTQGLQNSVWPYPVTYHDRQHAPPAGESKPTALAAEYRLRV
jgi:hypothetical protein